MYRDEISNETYFFPGFITIGPICWISSWGRNGECSTVLEEVTSNYGLQPRSWESSIFQHEKILNRLTKMLVLDCDGKRGECSTFRDQDIEVEREIKNLPGQGIKKRELNREEERVADAAQSGVRLRDGRRDYGGKKMMNMPFKSYGTRHVFH